jgi:inorganic triphosphatase YgiF
MSRDGPMRSGKAEAGSETELKLRVSPRRRGKALAALRAIAGSRRPSMQRLAATYYDTPGLELRQQRIALRVRREGRRWVQTVKGGGSAVSGVHQRSEIETPLAGRVPDLSRLPRHLLTRILLRHDAGATLVPVFETEIERTLFRLEPAPRVVVEAALDCGVLRSGRRREAVCEIELELKSGPVMALFVLARQLAARLPLALEHRSKAERGYALHLGAIAPPQKALPVPLKPGMTAGQAFRTIAFSALAQVQANEHGAANADDPEYLHQMRVGLRRLRALLRLFREPLAGQAQSHADALRDIAAALGTAREWDVLVNETLPAVPDRFVPARLLAVCQQARSAARSLAKKSIKTITYNDSMRELGQWLVEPGVRSGAAWQAPAAAVAAGILADAYARVRKRGRRLAMRTPAELHRLRIAVKRLRYAVEFFADLFQVKAMERQRRLLSDLQDILGCINDAAAVEGLFAAARRSGLRVPAAAAQAVIDWQRRLAGVQRRKLDAAWRRLRRAKRPWERLARRSKGVR